MIAYRASLTDILATILAWKSARMSVSVSVSAPWNASLRLRYTNQHFWRRRLSRDWRALARQSIFFHKGTQISHVICGGHSTEACQISTRCWPSVRLSRLPSDPATPSYVDVSCNRAYNNIIIKTHYNAPSYSLPERRFWSRFFFCSSLHNSQKSV